MSVKHDIRKRLLELLEIDLDDDSIEALGKKLANPAAGRLVFIPWGCGSKCVPGFQPDEEPDTGGRC